MYSNFRFFRLSKRKKNATLEYYLLFSNVTFYTN